MSDDKAIQRTDMTEEEALERWPDLDPEERERRRMLSIRARRWHAEVVDSETGRRRFGGPQPNSGPKKRKRVAERIAELAQGEHQQKVVDALFSGLTDKDRRVRVNAAVQVVKIEREERKLQIQEDQFDNSTKDELLEYLAPAIARMMVKGELPSAEEIARLPYDANGSVEED